jgi:hypothetical protein
MEGLLLLTHDEHPWFTRANATLALGSRAEYAQDGRVVRRLAELRSDSVTIVRRAAEANVHDVETLEEKKASTGVHTNTTQKQIRRLRQSPNRSLTGGSKRKK